MITEEKLQEAIAECWGEREPNANTCYKLAAYYTILNELRGNNGRIISAAYPFYSGDSQAKDENPQQVVDFDSDSEFAEAVRGMDSSKAWALMDELVMTVWATNKPLYRNLMRRLKE